MHAEELVVVVVDSFRSPTFLIHFLVITAAPAMRRIMVALGSTFVVFMWALSPARSSWSFSATRPIPMVLTSKVWMSGMVSVSR